MGTREHIIAYLTEVNELYDASGMASTRLATAVGYPGSSVAFAQLLSGMERSGLIEREVRGKRTYRISLGPAHAVGLGGAFRVSAVPGIAVGLGTGGFSRATGVNQDSVISEVDEGSEASAGAASAVSSGVAGVVSGAGRSGGVGRTRRAGSGIGTTGFDYDELARRLLVQVVRRLAATEPEPGPGSDPAALQETVNSLEYELATAWTKHGKLAEENVRLREQLRAAQRSLALAAERVRRLPASSGLDRSEVVLLQRLLTSDDAEVPGGAFGSGRTGGSGGAVGSGQEGFEEARTVVS